VTDVTSVVNNELSSLSFTFSADCWVEVRDGDNQKIFASMQRAQERLELQGKPPFRITLGYAPGVALSYNSQPVTIDSRNSNVAKLVLGNS
jgi:cytoskeleton protein RodZ